MTYPFIPSGLFPVVALIPQTTDGGPITADYISLKNVEMCWIHVQFSNGTASTDVITPLRSTVVASGGVALINTVPIWAGITTAASTQLTRITDALLYTGADVTGNRVVVIQIDPASLGTTYDTLTFTIANSGHAGNLVSATYWVKPKYQSKMASMAADEFIVD
jgi:hypothetical protein